MVRQRLKWHQIVLEDQLLSDSDKFKERTGQEHEDKAPLLLLGWIPELCVLRIQECGMKVPAGLQGTDPQHAAAVVMGGG